LHRDTTPEAQNLPGGAGILIGVEGIILGEHVLINIVRQNAGEIITTGERLWTIGTGASTTVIPALLALAVRRTFDTHVGIGADLAKATLAAKPVATVVATLFAQAVGNTHLLALACAVARLAKATLAAGTATTI